MKILAGTLLVYNGNKFDYCYKESIESLLNFCEVVIVVAGGDDETFKNVLKIAKLFPEKVLVNNITEEQWSSQKGKEKLAFFTNIAIEIAEKLGYEYQFNLQSDEIVHENSYSNILKAINKGSEAFMCKRINLWASPYMQLAVPLNRMPCSTSIIRLTKTKYRSVDDAENIGVSEVDFSFENDIRIYHMGFVRKQSVMKDKIINMQQNVFGMEHYDSKLDQSEIFNPDLWFDPKTDLKPIDEPLPAIIQEWAKERIYE
jgi:hypothetical protein